MGARAAAPPLPGLDSVPWLDNGRILQLRELPSHLVVLGGGFIGCEFAQMFRRFGSDVTVIDAAEHLLAREDPEVSTALADVFRGEGIALELARGRRRCGGATRACPSAWGRSRDLRLAPAGGDGPPPEHGRPRLRRRPWLRHRPDAVLTT